MTAVAVVSKWQTVMSYKGELHTLTKLNDVSAGGRKQNAVQTNVFQDRAVTSVFLLKSG